MTSASILRSATERLSIQKPQSGWTQRTRPGPSALLDALDARRATSSGVSIVIHLDVDHADAEPMLRVDVPEGLEIARRAVREFEHEMIRVQRIEEPISARQSPF